MKKQSAFLLLLVAFATSSFAQKGYLFIESSPDSGVVIIDGKITELYYTPVLCTLSVGEHSIEITRNFYETQMFKVVIEPEAVVRKRIDFVRQEKFKVSKPTGMSVEGKYGQLTIITNPHGAEVLADGDKINMTTPVTMSGISAGPHRYSIVHHYIQYDTTITITGDAPQTATINLKNLQGDDSYSIMPRVQTRVVIVVPGCEYKLDDSGKLLIKGVDAKISIRTGDTSLTLTHKELADFPATPKTPLEATNNEARLPKTEYTYIFEPYLNARLQFETITYASKKKFQLEDGIKPSTHYQKFPASLNSGKPVNVRIYIEDDGEVVFRYW
ncbi:MAG: PEGA domain-containing protein [Candidatus Zixiibacteriota bacterium]